MNKKTINYIGLGTAAIGRPVYINIKDQTKQEALSITDFRQKGLALLDLAYEQGVRYFDTAPGYGMAEEMLIDWVKEKEDMSIEIATKWGYTYVANFDPNAKSHEVKEHSLQKLNEQWSLSRQLLPHLTVYQIHSATLETGVLKNESILRRLAELKKEHGLVIGITTTGANQVEVLKKALDIEVEEESLFGLFQVTYNIFDQSLSSIANEIANQNKRLVIKEALANGRVFPNTAYPKNEKAYKLLSDLSNKYNTGIDAIALRFCMDSIPIYKVLSGASNPHHLGDNLNVGNFKLDQHDIELLKALSVDPNFYWAERKLLTWN